MRTISTTKEPQDSKHDIQSGPVRHGSNKKGSNRDSEDRELPNQSSSYIICESS